MKTRLLIGFLLFAMPLWADWIEEEAKIDYLLNEILAVDGVFVRNSTEYPPQQAVDHLRMKMNRAMSSWFSPNKAEWTAEMFIEKLASKSSLSGKSYQIRFNDGRTVNSDIWLRQKLHEFSNSP